MSLSMYEISVPVLVRNLNNLSAILKKGADYAATNGIDESVLINARLFPNMLPLSGQVQIACDMSKKAAARLSGAEPSSDEDNEASFEELYTRIANTVEFLKSTSPESINGSEQEEVTIQAGPQKLTLTGVFYLQSFVLPNVFFHTTTAYNILRHNGVELGKIDFIGAPE